MKKAFFFLLTLIVSNSYFGQFSPIFSKAADELKRSTLEIVMTGDKEIDDVLKLVVSDELSSFSYEFVSTEDFDNKHQDGDHVFALVLAKGDFDFPVSGGLVYTVNDLPFLGVITEYHQSHSHFESGFNLVAYTLNIPSSNELSVSSFLRLYLRNLNNETREPGEEFKAAMKERQDWAQEHELLMPKGAFASSLSGMKKVYPYPIKVVSPKLIEEAINNNEEVIICLPKVVNNGETTDLLVMTYLYAEDGTVIDMYATSFLIKKDEDKYKAMKAKAEQKALKVYAKNIK